jgi:hypothetical protein
MRFMLQRLLVALVVAVIPPIILIPVVIAAAVELLALELPARELSAQELLVAGDDANHFSGYQFSVKVNVKKRSHFRAIA